jgi:hypothetical protein
VRALLRRRYHNIGVLQCPFVAELFGFGSGYATLGIQAGIAAVHVSLSAVRDIVVGIAPALWFRQRKQE